MIPKMNFRAVLIFATLAKLLICVPVHLGLDLSDSGLLVLQPDTFKNLRHLKTLNLSRNKLGFLKVFLFTHNLNLSQLFLQENQLQNLLWGLPHLELLLLNLNRLRRLPCWTEMPLCV